MINILIYRIFLTFLGHYRDTIFFYGLTTSWLTYDARGNNQIRVKIRRKSYPLLSKTFDTKSEVEAWVNYIEIKMQRRNWISTSASEKTTVRDVLQRYRDEVLPTKKSQHPVIYQIKSINRFFGEYSLAALT